MKNVYLYLVQYEGGHCVLQWEASDLHFTTKEKGGNRSSLEIKSMESSLNESDFSEFSEFRQSDKSLKHELGSISRSSLVLWYHLGLLHSRWQFRKIILKNDL